MKTLLQNCLSLPGNGRSLLFFCLSLLFGTTSLEAATPSFADFFGTNGILIRTNGNKVQVDGQFLTNGASAVYFTTNLIVYENTYTSNLFATNITVENINITSNLFVNNTFATNIFVEQNIFTTNLYATNIFVDQELITSNFTTINNYSSNIITTNISINQTLVTSNIYTTNIFVGTIVGKDILWTNDNGTVRLIDEGRVGIGTNAGDALWLLERNVNAINYLNASSNGFVNFQIASNGNLAVIRGISYVWPGTAAGVASIVTNNGSGTLGNWPLSALPSFPAGLATFQTNQFTTNIAGSPVIGGLWLQGTTGGGFTNGARTAFEYSASNSAIRMGTVFGNGAAGIGASSSSTFSNFWDPTNVGIYSVAFGSNNLNRGAYSSILGGQRSFIETNADASVIAGGGGNGIAMSNLSATISGGSNNNIKVFAQGKYNTIGGGGDHSINGQAAQGITIAGGFANTHGYNNVAGAADYGTIGGGVNNSSQGRYSTIAGGSQNTISGAGSSQSGDYITISGGGVNNVSAQGTANASTGATIAGGQNNQIGDGALGGSPNGVISGGSNNKMAAGSDMTISGGSGNWTYNNNFCTISGGKSNQIQLNSGPAFILGGVSNNVNGVMGGIIGWWNTNSTAGTVQIGIFNTNSTYFDSLGIKADGITRTKAGKSTSYAGVGGIIANVTTGVISAGTAETNLQSFSVPANTLTNSGDKLRIRASGRLAATANAKQIKLIWGSETFLDTTSQIVNSGAWCIDAEIIRTGNTAQSVNASYNGNGMTLFTTANSKDLAQTNGIATLLKLTGTSGGDGDITNRTLTVEYYPASPQ